MAKKSPSNVNRCLHVIRLWLRVAWSCHFVKFRFRVGWFGSRSSLAATVQSTEQGCSITFLLLHGWSSPWPMWKGAFWLVPWEAVFCYMDRKDEPFTNWFHWFVFLKRHSKGNILTLSRKLLHVFWSKVLEELLQKWCNKNDVFILVARPNSAFYFIAIK